MQHILPFNFIPMVLEYCFFQWIFSPYKEKKKKKKIVNGTSMPHDLELSNLVAQESNL